MPSSNKTFVTQSNTHKEDENQIEEKHFPKRIRRNKSDGHTNESSVKVGSASAGARRSTHKRLSEATTQVFIAEQWDSLSITSLVIHLIYSIFNLFHHLCFKHFTHLGWVKCNQPPTCIWFIVPVMVYKHTCNVRRSNNVTAL